MRLAIERDDARLVNLLALNHHELPRLNDLEIAVRAALDESDLDWTLHDAPLVRMSIFRIIRRVFALALRSFLLPALARRGHRRQETVGRIDNLGRAVFEDERLGLPEVVDLA